MSELYAVEDGACWFVYHTQQARSKCCIFATHAQWEHGTSLLLNIKLQDAVVLAELIRSNKSMGIYV